MCGRFVIELPVDAMAKLFASAPANNLPTVPNYNVCPTTQVHAVSLGETGRRLSAMRWGFLPHWYTSPNDGPLLINARSETIAQKPAFREACRERRCILPISGFYEWYREGDEKQPWYIQRADGAPMAVAGIWQSWGADHVPTCAVVTTEATGPMADIHHRVPVVLEQSDWGKWLGEQGKGAALLMKSPAADVLQFHRVSKAVNSNRAAGPELIDPIAAE